MMNLLKDYWESTFCDPSKLNFISNHSSDINSLSAESLLHHPLLLKCFEAVNLSIQTTPGIVIDSDPSIISLR